MWPLDKIASKGILFVGPGYNFAPHICWARQVPSTRTQDKGTKARNVKFTSGYILNIHTPYLGTYYLRTTWYVSALIAVSYALKRLVQLFAICE